MTAKRIGLDFDNTIVCYDEVFSRISEERKILPSPVTKSRLRDYLRNEGREDEWTALQGEAYGPFLKHAKPFPGALEFIARLRREKIPVAIISHKTKHPFLGEKHDLHAAARAWLQAQGLSEVETYLELTKEDKLKRIAAFGCTHFVDDLPEFLAEPAFPQGVDKLLFNGSWTDIEKWILG
jgi:hypothetical protein